ncbi:hypothetical protein Pyn_00646 [Prunus yedoensis var. nudiflora]|uniref:Uncharacterized protein n=1 Tax=Prunus yedoensis var. nudiflora TaxID=2094558 RepID=A0A314YU39_PRUYE|nr:hypothetical protein Pyn_00646 [Prunus yedoensis var. nudiflora]
MRKPTNFLTSPGQNKGGAYLSKSPRGWPEIHQEKEGIRVPRRGARATRLLPAAASGFPRTEKEGGVELGSISLPAVENGWILADSTFARCGFTGERRDK